MPLVTDETRAGLEAYTAQDHMWMERAYMSEGQQTARQDALYNVTSIGDQRALQDDAERAQAEQLANQRRFIPYVYNLIPGRNESALPNSESYLVYWQTSPVLPIKGNT